MTAIVLTIALALGWIAPAPTADAPQKAAVGWGTEAPR